MRIQSPALRQHRSRAIVLAPALAEWMGSIEMKVFASGSRTIPTRVAWQPYLRRATDLLRGRTVRDGG